MLNHLTFDGDALGKYLEYLRIFEHQNVVVLHLDVVSLKQRGDETKNAIVSQTIHCTRMPSIAIISYFLVHALPEMEPSGIIP